MAVPPLDLLPTVPVKRVAWGRFRAASSAHASSPVQQCTTRAQPPRFAAVTATPWLTWDVLTASYIIAVHCLACAAPFTYTPSALRCFAVMYLLTGLLGVTFCFHRLLSHRSLLVPKWLEYFCAWLGCLASQSVRFAFRLGAPTHSHTAS
jgi:fatty-acid desaturase